MQLLTELGFTINFDKSVLIPLQQAIFLDFVPKSADMIITLTQEKIHKIVDCIHNLSKNSPSICEVAQVMVIWSQVFPLLSIRVPLSFDLAMCLSKFAFADLK